MASVRWADSAWSDLEQTADFISKDSPSYAASLVRLAREAARSLSQFSERGRIVSELQDRRIRELFISSYRMIYRADHDSVEILAFVHSARDFLSFWDGA